MNTSIVFPGISTVEIVQARIVLSLFRLLSALLIGVDCWVTIWPTLALNSMSRVILANFRPEFLDNVEGWVVVRSTCPVLEALRPRRLPLICPEDGRCTRPGPPFFSIKKGWSGLQLRFNESCAPVILGSARTVLLSWLPWELLRGSEKYLK